MVSSNFLECAFAVHFCQRGRPDRRACAAGGGIYCRDVGANVSAIQAFNFYFQQAQRCRCTAPPSALECKILNG